MTILKIEDVADILKITPQTLRNKVSRGDSLPKSFKLAGCRRRFWRQSDVNKWMIENMLLGYETNKSTCTAKLGRPTKKEQVSQRKRENSAK